MHNLATLYEGIYQAQCNFAHLPSFIKFIRPLLIYTEDASKFPDHLDEVATKIKPKGLIDSQKLATKFLISNDLNKIASALRCSSYSNLEMNTAKILDFFLSEFEKLGLPQDPGVVRTVKEFPKPFDKFKWAAFCPDSEDERRYEIPRGMYFLEGAIRPFYFEYLMAHELVHTIPGKNGGEILAMGLEEGLAELVGTLYLGQKNVWP